MTDTWQLGVNGVRLQMQLKGAGAALILLHGWTLDHRMWSRQAGPLGARFHVIAPDRRGSGRSTGVPDLVREPEDIAGIMDRLGLERAVLCAASQAGRVALRFALSHPHRMRALILQGSALDGMPEPVDDPGYIPIAEYARLVQSGAREEFQRRWLTHPFMAVPEGRDDLRAELETMVRECPCLDLQQAGALPPATTPDMAGQLGKISAPTLIIAGVEETPHRQAIARTLLAGIPGAHFAQISGGGHLINMINPQAYNLAIEQFLNGLPP
jgi:pimeloyl-ACP methyl ester carboxylesterase